MYGCEVDILTSDVVREICIKLEKSWCRNGRSDRSAEAVAGSQSGWDERCAVGFGGVE